MSRRERQPIQLAQSFDPSDRPREVGIVIDMAQRAECEVRLRAGQVVELTAHCLGEHPDGVAAVESKDLRAGVAEPLRGYQSETRRFAGTRRTDDERVPEVGNMQVETKRSGTARGGVKQRRAMLWHQRARVVAQTSPHGGDG